MRPGHKIRALCVKTGLAALAALTAAGPARADVPPTASRHLVGAVDTVSTPARCPVPRERFRDVTALLSRWADRRRRLSDVPGLVLGVACGPEITWSRGFGLADRERELPATDTTLFRIASITKVFTAHAVLQLRDEGRLDLDDRVADHLPWFELRNSGEMPPVTIRHLLTHTSGLPTNSAATDFNRMTAPTAEMLRAALPTQRLLFVPGSDDHYSNLGFAVLGQVVRSTTGRSYREHMEEKLLAPLGLRHTVVHPSPEAPQATGHHLRQPGRPRRPADFLHLASHTPAGGMAATARDMLRFLSFLMDPARARGMLGPETLREMQRVHHRADSARGGSGLGWAVERKPGVHEIYHGGGLPTQTSHLRLDLRRGMGVVVLANAEDADPATYAREALALLRLAADSAPARGHGPRNEHESERRMSGQVAGGSGTRRVPTVRLDHHAGRYRFQEREIWVVRLGGGLSLVDPLDDRPSRTVVGLVPLGGHRFRVTGGGSEGETAEFIVDPDSDDVLRLQLPSLMFRKIGPVDARPEAGSTGRH